ncbi:hypothetical protein MKY14_08155 [Paenibacillus sp. FSL R5-0887]|jgi:hypothetical protein|uniref:hypothetical protein n=1 Tax=Paenibacillus sp. FSL R5-0887 TaxID=2921662 RepID=UPI0030F80B84
MKKMLLSLFMVFGFMLLLSGIASADTVTEATYLSPINENEDLLIKPFAEIGPTYPGTSIEMKPGDVIHNPKSISTFFVGHVAIVGNDLLLRHSHPHGPGITEGISNYVSRFSTGDKFTILRPRNGNGAAAATWSQQNIGSITAYAFWPSPVYVPSNYCSKFVWQSYWFGAGKEIVGGGDAGIMVPPGLVYIYPSDILNSPSFVTMGAFYK